MRKLFKTVILGVSALALPFVFATTVNANTTIDNDIDTTLEYQTSTDCSSMRFISTIVLNNNRTLEDITNIELYFDLSKDGEETKRSKTTVQTKVYEEITGKNGKSKVDDTYYSVFKITDLTKNYTGWSITPYFKYNYSDHSTETVTASSWIIGVKRQYFVQTDTAWGTDLYYYMFGEGNVKNDTWPGEQMHLYDDDKHIYYFDYMPSAGYTNVIFNNGDFEGHKQTADMPVSSEYNYYLQQGDNAFAHATPTHDGVSGHDANGHWSCSTCKYDYVGHTLTGTTNGITRTVSCSDCGYSVSFDRTILYVTRNWDDWTNLHIYCWYNNGTQDVALNSWPGTKMTYDHNNEFNQEVYKVTIPENAQWIIINNGESDDSKKKQTVNIRLSDYENYNAFSFEWRDNANQVNGYLYIPENQQE